MPAAGAARAGHVAVGARRHRRATPVHAAQGGDVAMTMVDGVVLVRDGEMLHEDINKTIRAANLAIGPLLGRRDAWIANAGTAVNELEKS